MASVWGELKRRNVVKVAVAYAIVGWLLVEVASTMLPTFEAPQWVLQTITLVIILGFPLALVFAWAFELTPEGIKREKDVDRSDSITQQTGRKLDFLIIGVLGIAVVYLVADKLFWADHPSTLTPVSTEQSIAVLPFVNMSPDPAQEYFSDGIAEELLNQLTKLKGLHVAGRTSSFAFKGKNLDLRVIGERLNVAHILEGSVRKAGDRVRITVQLVKATDGYHLWSQTYDRELTDIFAIQEETAKAVAKALSITLGVGEGDLGVGGTRNFEAYDAYLAGISQMNQFEPESWPLAIEHLERAVALDPEYADAWSALATAYRIADIFVTESTEELYRKSEAAASRAIGLAPETIASLVAAAGLKTGSRDWMEAELLLRKALELAPTSYGTNVQLGTLLQNVGRPTDAIDYFRQAVKTEPLLAIPTSSLVWAYLNRGDLDEAMNELQRAEDLIGGQYGLVVAKTFLAWAMDDHALLDESLEKLANATSGPSSIRRFSQTMRSLLDSPEAARAELHRFYNGPDFNSSLDHRAIASWASYFDDPELALEAYQDAHETQHSATIFVIWAPVNGNMRRLPGFKDLLHELGLVDYWRSSGNWSEFCRPIGEDDFECE